MNWELKVHLNIGMKNVRTHYVVLREEIIRLYLKHHQLITFVPKKIR